MTILPRTFHPLLILIGFVFLLLSAQWTLAAESIESFDVDIFVGSDRSIRVEETIRVKAERKNIKRGIYREIPMFYRRNDGSTRFIKFNVIDVKKDGGYVSWFLDGSGGTLKIYVGDRYRKLDPGYYEYTIIYEVKDYISDYQEKERIYWNVTGNYWQFYIKKASVRVHFPQVITAESIHFVAGFTGVYGANDEDSEYRLTESGELELFTTRELNPREGLTLSMTFDKNLLTPSDNEIQKYAGLSTDYFLRYFYALCIALAFALICFAIWFTVGVDYAGDTIIPRFEPPKGVSPGAARMIHQMKYDPVCLTANILNLAAKKYLHLKLDGSTYEVESRPASSEKTFEGPDESKLFNKLFMSSDKLRFSNAVHSKISGILNSHRKAVTKVVNANYVVQNGFFRAIANFLYLLTLLGMSQFLPFTSMANFSIAIASYFLISIPLSQKLPGALLSDRSNYFTTLSASGVSFFFIGFIYVMATIQFTGDVSSISVFSWAFSWATQEFILVFLLVSILNIVQISFSVLVKRRTPAGYKQFLHIEGLRMYLSYADNGEIKNISPPEMSDEHFEKLLPYAVALGCENTWTQRFENHLLKSSRSGDTSAHYPRWYNDSFSSDSRGLSSFAAAGGVAAAMTSQISSSAVDPSSSSGGGGGGFSGGGGGGGGGGGW